MAHKLETLRVQAWGDISNWVYKGELGPVAANKLVAQIQFTPAEKAALGAFSMGGIFPVKEQPQIKKR